VDTPQEKRNRREEKDLVVHTIAEDGDREKVETSLRSLTTKTAGKCNVSGLNGDSLGVNGSQIGVFEQADQVGFTCFLKSADSRRLESQVSLEVLSNFSNKTLEGQLSDQELSRLLVSSNFSQGDGTGLVSVRLLDCGWCHKEESQRWMSNGTVDEKKILTTSCSWGRLSGSLGGQLLTRSLSSGALSSSLLGTSHDCGG
jgi:hypothetical protein